VTDHRPDRASMWLLRHLPEVVMTAPERIFLKFAVAMVGLGILLSGSRPGSIFAGLPRFVVLELGVTFVLGGTAALAGIVSNRRALERLGLAATAFASASYAVTVALLSGWQAATTIVIFIGLAMAALTRLLVSSAAARVLVTVEESSRVDEDRL
jgi:hypothetical protein